ncbi:hypothetical protein [Psychrobacter proteolyticus]|uniref:hypothetical protein n=1 Tax=Psychrobacter proteolyticus TaxID=147825 RepID=UPI000E0B8325|nr:hypothetical protein [Psychrobacter proteolyticus]
MSNNSSNNNEHESVEAPKNSAVTSVEVLKGDDVISEDEHDAKDDKSNKEDIFDKDFKSDESDKDDKSDKSDKDDNSDKEDKSVTIANIYQWASKLKDDFISDKGNKPDGEKSEEVKSDSDKSDKEDKEDKEDKYSAAVANVYQWAAKLKDDLKSEASGMTHGVSEKAVAMLLNKLLDGVNAELETFDKKAEDSEKADANTEKERSKLVGKKEKYQSMIDQLES